MTGKNIIEQQISDIRRYLKILGGLQKYSQKTIEDDPIIKGALERYLYLLAQETIQLGEAVVSLKEFRRPDTYAEVFRILHEHKFITAALAEKLIAMAKFRNFISHDYKKADYKIIYDILQNGLKDAENFLKVVAKKLYL